MRTRVFLALWGCKSVHSAPEVPAVIVQPTAESRAALASTLRQAFHGAPVTLADDALTTTNVLIIERVPVRDENGLPIDGRERGTPERFELVKSGESCVLLQQRTGKRFVLANTQCSPFQVGAREG
jgi:hypothetical protein